MADDPSVRQISKAFSRKDFMSLVAWAWVCTCAGLPKSMGLPQSRNRVYLIALRDNESRDDFTWPNAREPMALSEVLDPPAPNDDPRHMPMGKMAQRHAQEVRANLDPARPDQDWIADVGLSHAWSRQRQTQPNYVSPC